MTTATSGSFGGWVIDDQSGRPLRMGNPPMVPPLSTEFAMAPKFFGAGDEYGRYATGANATASDPVEPIAQPVVDASDLKSCRIRQSRP